MKPIFTPILRLLVAVAALALPCSLYAIDVNGSGGTPLNYQVVVGGTPTSWAVTSGSLPPGLLLNTLTGVITGVPNAADTYTPIVTATSGGTSTPVSLTFNISAAPGGSVQFTQAVFTHLEGAGSMPTVSPTMTLSRTGGSSGAVTASYTVYPSSITGNPVENDNYSVTGGTRKWVAAGRVTWADGDTADKTFPIQFISPFDGQVQQTIRYNRPGVDGTLRYEARLANLTGSAVLGSLSKARFDVLDADAPAAGVLNYDARIFYSPEGSTATITVRRDSGSTGAASVNYATSSTLPVIPFNFERLPSATAGQHYLATSGTLNWAAGDSATKSFTITLPATASTAGTLQVGLYLTSPTGAVLGNTASAVLTIQNPKSTLFAFNDETVYGQYRVYVPPGTAPLRGTLFLLSGTFGDTRNEVVLSEFQAVANLWRFALVGVNGTYSFDPGNNLEAEIKLGELMDKLDLVANTTARPELRNAPIAFSGMSAGGYNASRSFLPWPERTIGVIAHNAWQAPTTTYNPLTPLQSQVPGLLMPGMSDTTVPLSEIGPSQNTSRQYGQTRSAIAVVWGLGHNYVYKTDYNGFSFYWFEQMMKAGRYPEGVTPTVTTAPTLGSLALNSGWWGARNSTNSTTNGYQISGGSSRFLKIESDAANTLIKDPTNALVDSWLPTEGAARAYRAQASLQTISFSTPLSFDERILGIPTTLGLSLNSYGNSITSVEYFDGTTSLGSTSTAPYTLDWTPANSGLRGITAVATSTSGLPYTTATYVFVPAPAIPFAPATIAADSGNAQLNLVWTSVPNATSYNVYEASSALGPFTLVQSGITSPNYVRTGITNGTPYYYKVTATNSLGSSEDSRLVRATPGATAALPIIQESFNYPIPTNNPDPDAGVNNNNGLPAVNVDGSPSGTSTGLRGNWGTTTDVVAGLTYAQGTKTLTTSGGAGRINNATWGGNPYFYRNMTTDPYLAQRIGGSGSGNFGVDGSSIYLSFLAQTSSSTAGAFNFSLRYDGTQNFFISNTSTGWSLSGTNATGAALMLNTPTLMVVRMDFSEGPSDRVSLWVNPPLGVALGVPNATVIGLSFPGIGNVQTKAAVVNAMTLDELRVGTSLAAVIPFTDSITTPVLTPSQSASTAVGDIFSYQILANSSPTSYALASGSLPPGITLNSTTGILSGTPTTVGNYTPSFTATNAIGTSSPAMVTITVAPPGSLILSEPFAYTVGTNAPDPDGGLNSGNGLPATNTGGTPSGTSTGLRGSWGVSTDVVTGLAYVQGTKTLTTSGGAALINNATWGGQPYIYQNMNPDPFVAQRIGGANNGNLGVDGTSLFVSFLAQTSSATDSAFRFSFKYDGVANFYVSNTATGWSLNGTNATGAALALNTPTLIVLRFDFAPEATDAVSLWVNPSLGAPLGTSNATVSGISFPGILNLQTRAAVANAMTLDELRVGTSLAAVTPFTDSAPSTTGMQDFRTANGLATDGSQDLLTPAGDGVQNLLKYAFNMIGNGAGQGATLSTPNTSILAANGIAGMPLGGVGTGPEAGKLQLTYIRCKSDSSPGVTYAVEFSDALSTWATNGSATESTTSIDSTFERVTVTDSSASPAKRFVRVRVTAQ